jgi:formyl-CoA transferase
MSHQQKVYPRESQIMERDISGEGQWVQTSLQQAQNLMLDFQAARWLTEKDGAKQAATTI